jgi:homoserine O-acetyltransferase
MPAHKNIAVLSPREGVWTSKDFACADGRHLEELRIGYRTLGKPVFDSQGDVSNAVVLLHGTTSSSDYFLTPTFTDCLFGERKVLDANKYFIVLPDSLGHGRSSKPSDGLRTQFPNYGYGDMVRAHSMLLTEGIGVRCAQLVSGVSMGGMHTWMWGHLFPKFALRLFPLTSHPVAIAGRNLLWRQMLIEAIRNDPAWEGGNYVQQPTIWRQVLPLRRMLFDGPGTLLREVPDPAAAKRIVDEVVKGGQALDANDVLYAFEASHDYDPDPHLELIEAELTSVNFADDSILCPDLGIMERAIARVPRGRAILVGASEFTNGHQSQARPELWAPLLDQFLH